MKYFGNFEIELVKVGRTSYVIIFTPDIIELDEICPICETKLSSLKAERPIIVESKNPPCSISHQRIREKLAITKLNFKLKKIKDCVFCLLEKVR